MAATKIECKICGKIKEKHHWQKNHQPHIRPEVSAGMLRAINEGRIKSWNKGLRKGNCPSIQKQSQSLKEHWGENGHPRGMLGKKHSNKTKEIMSNNRQKDRNSNWKGGVTKLVRGIRRSPEYYQWRKKVLTRDKFICRKCGSGRNINSHHIRSILDYPEGIFEVSNGVSLCENCHRMTESYGIKKKGKNGNNTHRMV